MKKLFVLIFVIMLMLAFVGCSGDGTTGIAGNDGSVDAPTSTDPAISDKAPATPSGEPSNIPDQSTATNVDMQVLDLRITDTESLVRAYNENTDFRAMMDLFSATSGISLHDMTEWEVRPNVLHYSYLPDHLDDYELRRPLLHARIQEAVVDNERRFWHNRNDFPDLEEEFLLHVLAAGVGLHHIYPAGGSPCITTDFSRLMARSQEVEVGITGNATLVGVSIHSSNVSSHNLYGVSAVFIDLTGSQIIWYIP